MGGRATGTIFLVVGIVMFLVLESVAVVLTVRAVQRSDWPHADGTVVEVSTYVDRGSRRDRKRGSDRETTMYTPVVEFTVDGELYRLTSKVSTSNPWTVGDTVDVVHNPENPHEASISGSANWVPWMLGGMGLVFAVVFGGVGWMIRTGRMGGRSSRRAVVGSRTTGRGDTYKDFSAPSRADDDPSGGPFGRH